MIKRLGIENFKSIKHLEIECKKVNVLIGKPNTGKSNILEALGLVCALQTSGDISEFIRYREVSDLYHFKEGKPIHIVMDGKKVEFYSANNYRAEGLIPQFYIEIPEGASNVSCNPAYSPTGDWKKMLSDKCFKPSTLTVPAGSTVFFVNKDTASHAIVFARNPLDSTTWQLGNPKFDSGQIPQNGSWSIKLTELGEHPYVCYLHPWMIGRIIVSKNTDSHYPILRFYRFREPIYSMAPYGEYLYTPHGSNLNHIIKNNKDVRKYVNEILKGYGPSLFPTYSEILIVLGEKKVGDDMIIDDIRTVEIPYNTLSDGLQRIIFYAAAILSNKNAVIVLEEPEAHIFPVFTKHIAELIAYDENNNQFFISTHNPYFLLTLVEKCKKEDINILVTYLDKNRTTCVKSLREEEIQQLLEYDYDLFFNVEKSIGGEDEDTG
ncbi:MAG: AAA family ATPase [Candidatus Nitrosocaldus sp.]